MKATIEFDLPEDTSEHLRAVNASTAWVALYEIDNKLRNLIKYGIREESSYQQELIEIRKEINEVTALLGNN